MTTLVMCLPWLTFSAFLLYVSCVADKSAPDGELWHTYSVLNVIVASDVHNHTAIPSTLTWQYFFAAGMTADHNISTSKMSQCMAYSTNVSTPGQTLPVVLHKACTPAVRINATGMVHV